MLELRHVATFRVVAQERSFSRAAARLGYVQSSVSSQVAALEREFGAPLFDRLGRAIRLTEAGRALLPYAEGLLALAEEAGESVREAASPNGELAGSLTLGAPESLLAYRLPGLLALFHERHPKVKVSPRPTATGRLVGESRRRVEEGEVDVAFVLDRPARTRHPGLWVETLMEEPISVVAPPSHALAGKRRVSPADLSGEALLPPEAPRAGCAYRELFERQLDRAAATPREVMEFASVQAVKQCVVAGVGVAVLPTVAAEAELKTGRLTALRWSEDFGVATQLAWNRRRWVSPALRGLLETAREAFAFPQTTP